MPSALEKIERKSQEEAEMSGVPGEGLVEQLVCRGSG